VAEKVNLTIEDVDFIFENTPVRVIANRSYPEIALAGIKFGPFKEGEEYEIVFWAARELEKAGVVRFRQEDFLDLVRLHKIHWKERAQTSRQISALPESFYPKLRRFLMELRIKALKNPDKMREYEKAVKISKDIVNCRLRKIVSLASAPTRILQMLENLTVEEKALYQQLHNTISDWRARILSSEKGEEE